MLERRRFKAGEAIIRENDLGETAFIIEKGTPGFSVNKGDEKLGTRGSDWGERVLEEAGLDVDAMAASLEGRILSAFVRARKPA